MADLDDLPLRSRTPEAWARAALEHPLALLDDHAHLERKAASNALELLGRWPEPRPPEEWETVLTSVARDEAEHLALVVKLIRGRGGRLTRHHRNPYAQGLRAGVRRGLGTEELADRLFVSALIEARSCERFEVLGRCCEDDRLGRLYRGLWASEAGHFRVFLHLARLLLPAARCEERWAWWLDTEAALIAAQPPGPRIHSGPPEGAS